MKKRVLSLALAVLMALSLLPTAASASTGGKTADDAINWVRSKAGQPLDYDGAYGAQCVDLICYYYRCLGQTSPGGYAKEYRTNALPSGWQRLQGVQPQKGDILVYNPSAKNEAGHVAIYESDYSTWHQNYADRQYVVNVTNVRYDNFDNTYWGVIRPDFSSVTPAPTFDNIGADVYRLLIRSDSWKHIGTNYYDSNSWNVTISRTNNANDPAQIWRFIRQADGSYYVQNMFNEEYLTYEGNCASQAKVTTAPFAGQRATRFQWYIKSYNGIFKLIAKDSVTAGNWLVLDCKDGSSAAGTQMQLYGNWAHTSDNSKAQLFSLYTINYVKPARPAAVQITIPSVVSAKTRFTVQWTESPLQGVMDERWYLMRIRSEDDSLVANFESTARSDTCAISKPGRYYVTVLAKNTKFKDYSTETSKVYFTVTAEHIHQYTSTVTPPTCTEQGYTTYTCTCGDSYRSDYTNPLGHSWDAGVVTTPATETAPGVKRYTCTRCSATRTETIAQLTCPSAGFTDVPGANNWAHAGIDYCVSNGLMYGVGGSRFAPQTATTRAQIVQILYSLSGSPSVSGAAPFTDLTQDWYKNAVRWAYQTGVVSGMSATTFAPNVPVTREQIAVILMGYAQKVLGVSRTWTPADLSRYPDASRVSAWAHNALADTVSLGLISGTLRGGQAYLDPQGSATREQVATILMQFCKNVKP